MVEHMITKISNKQHIKKSDEKILINNIQVWNKDKIISKKILIKIPILYKLLFSDLQCDKTFVLDLLDNVYIKKSWLPKKLKSDVDVMIRICQYDAEVFRFLPEHIKQNKRCVIDIINSCRTGLYIFYSLIPKKLLEDMDIIMTFISKNKQFYNYMLDEHKINDTVVTYLLKINGKYIEMMQKKQKIIDNEKYILLATQTSPKAIKFASNRLRMDENFCNQILKIKGESVQYMPLSIRKNISLILIAQKTYNDAYIYACPSIKDNIIIKYIETMYNLQLYDTTLSLNDNK